MSNRSEMEIKVANAIVGEVCSCGPTKHTRGFPECATARRAARIAVEKLFPVERCKGSGFFPMEATILDTVPGVNPMGTCIRCKRSFTLNVYDKLPEHES